MIRACLRQPTSGGADIVARARSLIGVRFRPQGRDREGGLDCIGLAAVAVGAEQVRSDYALRGGTLADLETELGRAGLRRTDRRGAGDLLVMRSGAEQLHLGVWTGDGLVHADAGLRRIVERPGPPPWPILSQWRVES